MVDIGMYEYGRKVYRAEQIGYTYVCLYLISEVSFILFLLHILTPTPSNSHLPTPLEFDCERVPNRRG